MKVSVVGVSSLSKAVLIFGGKIKIQFGEPYTTKILL